jgi:hypothetical protein
LQKYGLQRAEQAGKVVKEIASLPDKHVALHLLRASGDFCRMSYLARTTPKQMVTEGLTAFDGVVRGALERIVGEHLENDRWDQARLPARLAGLGLRGSDESADAAYAASRYMTKDLCAKHLPGHAWDAVVPGSHTGSALSRIISKITDPARSENASQQCALEVAKELLDNASPQVSARGLQRRLMRGIEHST